MSDVNDPTSKPIVYIYDAEKVEETNRMVILPQLYTVASTETIQDISNTIDVETSPIINLRPLDRIIMENLIDTQYNQMSFYINHIGICIVMAIICVIIIGFIYFPR
jgi:hypothetical protein